MPLPPFAPIPDDALLTQGQVAELTAIFGPHVDVYTRAQAIADGALVEVPERTAREAGIRHHLVLSAAAWADTVAWSEADDRRKGTLQDEAGRLWDVLTMTRWSLAAVAARYAEDGVERFTAGVQVMRVPRPGRGRMPRKQRLVLHFGVGDDGVTPVFTLMMPGED